MDRAVGESALVETANRVGGESCGPRFAVLRRISGYGVAGAGGLPCEDRLGGLSQQTAQKNGVDTEQHAAVQDPVGGHVDEAVRQPRREIGPGEPERQPGDAIGEVEDGAGEVEQDRRFEEVDVVPVQNPEEWIRH